jgi:hypothetical protein
MLSILLFLGLAALIVISTKLIMTKVSELAAALGAVADRVTKAQTEILAEIETLKGQIGADADLSPEAQASLDRLTGLAQALDDINVDVPPPTTP